MDNLLIIGANSLIAQAYQSYCVANKIDVITTSRKPDGDEWYFDLADASSIEFLIEAIQKVNISVVLVCAAITSNVDCLNNRELSQKVNVSNTSLLLSKLNDIGIFSVFLSSSQVFNHQTANIDWQDSYSSTTLYGQQKVDVESFIKREQLNTAIVRLTKIIGSDFPLFGEAINKAKNKQIITVFDDYCAAPISVSYVVKYLAAIVEYKKNGVYQLSGAEDLSYAQMIERLLTYLNINAELDKVSARTKNILPVAFGSLTAFSPMTKVFKNQSFDDLLLTTYFEGASYD